MTQLHHNQRIFLKLGIPFALLLTLIAFVKSSYFQTNSNLLTLGISLDLLVTIPLVYFLLIRKTTIPKTTVVPFMIIGLIIGMYILPENQQYYLQLFKSWALPVIELTIFTFVVIKVRKTILSYRKLKNTSPDFYTAVKEACKEILPQKLVIPFAMEVSVMYYGFINWKRKKLAHNEFSYHKDTASVTLFLALILLIAVEMVTVHILLAKWSEIAAWILTILSAYSGIQILGFAKSLTQRPTIIEEDQLILRYGIMAEIAIPYQNIKKIELSKKSIPEDDKTTKFLSLLGETEGHNIILHVHEEATISGLYGIKKKFKKLAFHIDAVSEFKNQLAPRLENQIQHSN